MRVRRSIFAAGALLLSAGGAAAQEGSTPAGQPHPWQMGLQEALSPIEAQIHWFSNYVLAFIVPITILVAALLGWCVYRFRESRNREASRTSHNTLIEVVWTLAPVIVLLFIAVPSFQLLTAQYNPPSEPELTVKATGYQWYWGYEYQPSNDSPEAQAKAVSFDSYPLAQLTDSLADQDAASEAKGGLDFYPRLLAVDNEMVVPVNTVIRVTTTSADVIHSWAVPSMGVKVDAVPGRLNEYWFEALKEGLFYGQCSELCGQNHANMPIAVRVVSKEQFQKWYAAAAEDVGEANKQLMAEVDGRKAVEVAGR
ncbi:cytochrome c oxidase subunit II [Aurantimonas sp. VKM B-3413]|uniref:cytochrome c oxidase subunit II n=1 Tax=Aurantimonas sp. VKM B-3413 TaxID=2779401 RepID=UPI001E606B95|nr:cytochrome c oxidase subunit II [Aurantimonas sp. VKM B-3413]MCB8839147.1 cytochrome c oxidase subunit II [Aurantimonas sp. VKM B-3413]